MCGSRWGRLFYIENLEISAWSLEDAVELLRASKDYAEAPFTFIHVECCHTLWGRPGLESWATGPWTRLLQNLTYGTEVIVDKGTPLQGLLGAVCSLTQSGYVIVCYGTIDLGDVETWANRAQDSKMQLVLKYPHVVVPSVQDGNSLRHRVDTLCDMRNNRGDLMVERPRLVTETGECFSRTCVK